MSGQTVLMLAEHDDAEASYVSDALARRGVEVAWFDTAWFPSQARVSARLGNDGWYGEMRFP